MSDEDLRRAEREQAAFREWRFAARLFYGGCWEHYPRFVELERACGLRPPVEIVPCRCQPDGPKPPSRFSLNVLRLMHRGADSMSYRLANRNAFTIRWGSWQDHLARAVIELMNCHFPKEAPRVAFEMPSPGELVGLYNRGHGIEEVTVEERPLLEGATLVIDEALPRETRPLASRRATGETRGTPLRSEGARARKRSKRRRGRKG